MNFKKIATITMAALLAISSSMPASAKTKDWHVYHNQGAPTKDGVYNVTRTMPKGGTVAEVKMTHYENISHTSICAYRLSNTSAKQYLTSSSQTVNLYVRPAYDEKIRIHMSTTSGLTTSATGTIIR